MLIFQPHLPYIIMNSRRPLHDLSHFQNCTLDIAALVEAAAHVEWAWKTDTSTHVFQRQHLSHLAIVLEDTGLCWLVEEWNKQFSPLSLRVITGYKLSSSLYAGKSVTPTVPWLLPRSDLPIQREFIMPAWVPHIAAWPLSGCNVIQEAFQQRLLDYSQPPGETKPLYPMKL